MASLLTRLVNLYSAVPCFSGSFVAEFLHSQCSGGFGNDTQKRAWYYFYKRWLQKLEQIILPDDIVQFTRMRYIYGEEIPLEKLAPFAK